LLALQFGVNQFTEMTVQQRAKHLGFRRNKKQSAAAYFAEQAEMLRRTSRISGAQMELAAQAMEAVKAAEAADDVFAAQAVPLADIPDW
jgi:hypothetical protein